MFIPRIACSDCGCALAPVQNGRRIEVLTGSRPYYKISTDLYECPGCGVRMLTFASAPLAEHYEIGYSDIETEGKVQL